MPDEQSCRSCRCTDDDCLCCIIHTGMPCSWAVPGLCTACADILEPACPGLPEQTG